MTPEQRMDHYKQLFLEMQDELTALLRANPEMRAADVSAFDLLCWLFRKSIGVD